MRHDKCGGVVYVDVSSAFLLLAGVSTSPREETLHTISIIIEQNENTLAGLSYICSKCFNSVDKEDIYFRCRACSKNLEANEAFVPRDSNGKFCENCIQSLLSEEATTTMESLLEHDKLYVV